MKFEDLKLGSKIVNFAHGYTTTVEAIGPSFVLLSRDVAGKNEIACFHKNYWQERYWSESPIQEHFAEKRIMSPAVYNLGGTVGTSHNLLYESEEQAKENLGESVFISWPLKYPNGKPVEYLVEIKK